MAKKKEKELTYLQLPLPEPRKYYRMAKKSWTGLNKRQVIDTGNLSKELNISTAEAPYLTPSQSREPYLYGYDNPLGLFGFDNFLIVIYREQEKVFIDYVDINDDGKQRKLTGTLQNDVSDVAEECQRSVVQFNVYDTPTDPVSGQYVKRLLIFPDKKSMAFTYEDLLESAVGDEEGESSLESDFKIYDMDVDIQSYYNDTPEVDASGAIIYPPPETASHNCYYRNTYSCLATNYGTDIYKWCEYETLKREDDWGLQKDEKGNLVVDKDGNYIKYGFVKDENGNYITEGTTSGWKISIPPAMPDLKYATVHLSRVFGVDGDRVYASGFNNYANWNLDTIDEYNESNAWCSPSQSNTKAGGDFTGITTFQGHVVCFKRDFMHEIYNTKNPFRLTDIYAEGAVDNRTIQDVDGKLIFVSEDDVKIYTGSNPRIIGYNLNLKPITYAVSGTDNRNYYLYCEDERGKSSLYVYDTMFDQWSEQDVHYRVINFAHNKNGMYMLCENGIVYKLDTGEYEHEWCFETDLITNETVDIKHIKKIQMLADIANGSSMEIYILYDDEEFNKDTSHLVYSSNGEFGRKTIRVKPRQTAHYGAKLRVNGYGYVKLYELELSMQTGGDLYAGN